MKLVSLLFCVFLVAVFLTIFKTESPLTLMLYEAGVGALRFTFSLNNTYSRQTKSLIVTTGIWLDLSLRTYKQQKLKLHPDSMKELPVAYPTGQCS